MGEVLYAAPLFASHEARHLGHPARILIVDADPAALAAIAQVLQSEGHFTATAFDAAGADAIADRLGPFDLLITDVRTTPIDGLELAERLRARGLRLQVLYLTRTRDDLAGRAIRLSDEDDVLGKPFSESELMDAVTSLLYWARPGRTR